MHRKMLYMKKERTAASRTGRWAHLFRNEADTGVNCTTRLRLMRRIRTRTRTVRETATASRQRRIRRRRHILFLSNDGSLFGLSGPLSGNKYFLKFLSTLRAFSCGLLVFLSARLQLLVAMSLRCPEAAKVFWRSPPLLFLSPCLSYFLYTSTLHFVPPPHRSLSAKIISAILQFNQ